MHVWVYCVVWENHQNWRADASPYTEETSQLLGDSPDQMFSSFWLPLGQLRVWLESVYGEVGIIQWRHCKANLCGWNSDWFRWGEHSCNEWWVHYLPAERFGGEMTFLLTGVRGDLSWPRVDMLTLYAEFWESADKKIDEKLSLTIQLS